MAAPRVYKTVNYTPASTGPTDAEKAKIKAIVNAFFNHFNAKHIS